VERVQNAHEACAGCASPQKLFKALFQDNECKGHDQTGDEQNEDFGLFSYEAK